MLRGEVNINSGREGPRGNKREASEIWKQSSTQIDGLTLVDQQRAVALVSNVKGFEIAEVLRWDVLIEWMKISLQENPRVWRS